MPRFSLSSRRLVLCWALSCALLSSCAAPRTFVSEPKTQTARTADAPAKTPADEIAPPKSAPNHPEPSVWTKLTRALVPSKPKPTKRIPLPRTDLKSSPFEEAEPAPLEESLGL